MGPELALTALTAEPEAIAVVFCRHTLPPLEDLLYDRQAAVQQRFRSILPRGFQRRGISRLPLSEEGLGEKE